MQKFQDQALLKAACENSSSMTEALRYMKISPGGRIFGHLREACRLFNIPIPENPRGAISRDKREEFRNYIADLPEAEISWFAGWTSGDGSVLNAGKTRPRIRFTLTDKDPLDKFSDLFGNRVHGPYNPTGLGKLPRFVWQISGWRACVVLNRIYPWLSNRYQERSTPYLNYEAHGGRKLNPAQVLEIKKAFSSGKWGTNRDLAQKYGVTDGLISSIKQGRAWSHIREED